MEEAEQSPAVKKAMARFREAMAEVLSRQCPGYGRGGTGKRCCDRAGMFDGKSGPIEFRCPNNCGCHN